MPEVHERTSGILWAESEECPLATLAGLWTWLQVRDLRPRHKFVPRDYVAQGALGGFGDPDSRRGQDPTNAVSVVCNKEVGMLAGQVLVIIPFSSDSKGLSQPARTAGQLTQVAR